MSFIVISIVLVAGIIACLKLRGAATRWEDAPIPTIIPTVGAVVGTLLLGVYVVFSVLVIVPPGHVGVGVLFGKVQEQTYTEGPNLVNPFVDVAKMGFQSVHYEVSGSHDGDQQQEEHGGGAVVILSKDDMRVTTDVTVVYSLVPEDAGFIYRFFSPDAYTETLVRAPVHAVVRDVGSKYTFRELYGDKRDEASGSMRKHLQELAQGLVMERDPEGKRKGVFIQQVLLKKVSLPKRLTDAIEAKMAADQDAQRMDYVLQKEEKEATRKAIEARGIKDFQDIVRQGIDPLLLAWKGVEATEKLAASDNAKVVIIGNPGNGLPLVLGDLTSKLDGSKGVLPTDTGEKK